MSEEVNTNADDDCAFLVRAGRKLIEQCGIGDDLRNVTLDPANVPSELHPLIPCAEVWNIGDDYLRGHILYTAPPEILRQLVRKVHKYFEILDNWRHTEYTKIIQSGGKDTEELAAFSGLEITAVDAKEILSSRFGEEHEL
jgi:hypothetical protein